MPHLLARGADQEALTAAIGLLRYFDTSAVHHHADEEDDPFPALIESMAGSDAICLRAMIDGLTADHRALEASWQHLRSLLEGIAAGECVPLSADDVEVLASRFEQHIKGEEHELLPMAARLLSDDDLARIGRAMRERRAIDDAQAQAGARANNPRPPTPHRTQSPSSWSPPARKLDDQVAPIMDVVEQLHGTMRTVIVLCPGPPPDDFVVAS